MNVTIAIETVVGRREGVRLTAFDEDWRELTGVEVVSLEHRLGATPAKAVLAVVLESFRSESGVIGTQESSRRMEALYGEQSPLRLDRRVRIGLMTVGGGVMLLFDGRVTDEEISFTGSRSVPGEWAHVVARDVRDEAGRLQVVGQFVTDGAGGRMHVDVDAVMNAGGFGNLDTVHRLQEGSGAPMFADAGENSGCWTVADAIRYLLGHYRTQVNLEFPATVELGPAQTTVLPETSLEGKPWPEALWEVLRSAGLDGWVDPVCTADAPASSDRSSPTLQLVDVRSAPVRELNLAAAGSTFSPVTSELRDGRIIRSRDGTRNVFTLRGALDEYEARFELVPLWTSTEEEQVTAAPNRGRRGQVAYEPTLDAVFRRWGLNEDGVWTERPTYDFSGLFPEAMKRRRPFSKPFHVLGREGRPVVVEIKSDVLDPGWHGVGAGTIRLLPDRAGIYFECEDVDGSRSWLRAGTLRVPVALMDVTAVRMTAVVQSDRRVSVTAGRRDQSGTDLVIEHIVTDEQFHRRYRDVGSAYAGEGTGMIEDAGAPDGVMEQRARSLRERHEGTSIEAMLTVPWVDLTFRPGVRVSGIQGRNIPLRGKAGDQPGHPLVCAVRWDLERQTTTLTLGTLGEDGR